MAQGPDQPRPHHPLDEADLTAFTARMVQELRAPAATMRELVGRLERAQGDAAQQMVLLTAIAAEAEVLAALVEEVRAAALGEHDGLPTRRGDDAPRRDER
jgi:signal transduction histidine kinase